MDDEESEREINLFILQAEEKNESKKCLSTYIKKVIHINWQVLEEAAFD